MTSPQRPSVKTCLGHSHIVSIKEPYKLYHCGQEAGEVPLSSCSYTYAKSNCIHL